jgi:NADPH:quinone reductase-like Zn-dependent oxidoreductase
MKRVQYDRYGGPDEMYIGEYTLPRLARNEVRVSIKAAAINPLDWKLRRGAMKLLTHRAFPKGMGSDFSGVVEAIGDKVSNVKVGDEVFGSMSFKKSYAFSETIIVNSHELAKKRRSFPLARPLAFLSQR